jgi:hypothetical protein
MTNEEVERTMQFLLQHHAKMSTDIEGLKEVQRLQAENIDRLTVDVQALRDIQERQAENLNELTANVEAMREEMQDSFNKLILANEVTRKLAEDVARLAVQTSQRVTNLEGRVSDLDAK